MDAAEAIEQALQQALERACSAPAPPGLAAAMRAAVFPGGARIRPRLTLAVAAACGDAEPALAMAAGAALELMHCASLVLDDLPAFDDAAMRRGRPSVHAEFGEALAILAGTGLIVLAAEEPARADAPVALRLACTMDVMQAVGSPVGLVAGQAWESEPRAPLRPYHQAKTGALFVAACRAGARAGGGDPEAWSPVGALIGEAYQVADDLADALGEFGSMGKPAGRDAALGRPSAVGERGLEGARSDLESLLDRAARAVPPCAAPAFAESLLAALAERLRGGAG